MRRADRPARHRERREAGASNKLADTLSGVSSFPGGNDGIMRHVLKKLVPGAIDGEGFAGILNGRVRFDELDREGNPTRIRLASTAMRVANRPDGSVEVIYTGRPALTARRRAVS